MKKIILSVVGILFSTTAYPHEWTPTYPKFEPSFLDGIVVTTMKIFNKREDVNYYEISVFDENWNTVPFASSEKILNVAYLGQKNIDIYVRRDDCDRIKYICTTSKQFSPNAASSGIDSRICSKVQYDRL